MRSISAAGTEIPGTWASMKRSADDERRIVIDGRIATRSASPVRTASAMNASSRSGSNEI